MGIPATLSTVPAQTPYIQYVATSGQTVFPYPFEITQDSDLVVVANGVTLATDSGYTVSGVGASTGGNITFTSGRAANDIITLYRDIPIERLTQFAQNGGFSSTAFNAEFNNVYLLLQQLQQGIDQCLQIPNTNNPAPTTTLTPGAYASKYLAFDANGNPEPAVLTSSGSLTASILSGLMSIVGSVPFLESLVKTPAEIAAEVTPTNYAYAPLDTRRYGTKGDGTTDDTAAIQAASDVAKQLTGGGVVMLLGTAGNSFKVTAAITLAAGVEVRGQGEQVTTVTQATANADCFQGTNASFAKISSLSISMPDTGTGVAIHWICSGTHDFYYPRVDSVQILQVAGSGVGIWADNQSNTNTIYWPDIQRTVIQGGAANDYQSKIGVQWGGAGSVIVVGPTMRAVRAFRVQKGFYGYNCDAVRGSDCSLDDCQGGSGVGVHLHNAGFCQFQGLRMEPMTFDTFIQCDSGASGNGFDVVDFGNIPSAKVVDNGTNNEFWGSDGSGGFINTIKLPVNISDVNSITVGPGQTPAGTPLTLYHATTATVNPGAIAAGAAVDTAVSIPGVIGTDKAIANPPAGLDAGLMCSTLIGTGLVYIRLANITGSPVTPVSQVWNIAVLR